MIVHKTALGINLQNYTKNNKAAYSPQVEFCYLSSYMSLFHGTEPARYNKNVQMDESANSINRDCFMVGECVRFLFTSCEGSLNERVSAANERV